MLFQIFHFNRFSRSFPRVNALFLGFLGVVWTFMGIGGPDFLWAQEKTGALTVKAEQETVAVQPTFSENSRETQSEPLRFRRVYISQELLPEIPTFGKNYWPVPEKEFNIWLAENAGVEKGASPLPKVLYAEKAIYHARLSESKCFSGTALFRIRRIPEEATIPSVSGTSGPLFWSFPPVNLALKDQLEVLQTKRKTSSSRDFNFLPNGGGEVVLNADDFSSTESPTSYCDAEITWSKRFIVCENGDLRLNLEWIPATDTQWVFELPPEWIPETSDGLVVLERIAQAEPEENTESSIEPDSRFNVWRIAFGGRRKASLTFRSRSRQEFQETPISCTQKNTYQFRKDGMDVYARINLTPFFNASHSNHKPVRELKVQLEENLVPVSVRFNGTELTWTSHPQKEGALLNLQIPEDFSEMEGQLEISAIGNLKPWLSGVETPLHTLPGIQLLSVPRLECRTQILFFSPLEITDFILQNAYLISNSQLPNTSQVQMEFMETSPSAQLQFALARQKTPLTVDLTTAMDFQEHEISAVTEMLVSIQHGESFDVWGFVDRSWTIDSVEVMEVPSVEFSSRTASVSVLEDWNVDVSQNSVHQILSELNPTGELSGKLAADGWDIESLGILHIQLAHSIRPKHPVSIQIRARRLGYSSSYSLTGIQLTPIYLPTCQIGQSWILCGSSTGWNIKFLEPYREQDVPLEVHASNESSFSTLSSRKVPILSEEPVVKSESEAKPESVVKPETEVKSKAETKPEANPHTNSISKDEQKKKESFSAVLFPTLAEARKQFPAQMTFKTGIQDFKKVPMLRLEHSAREFSAEVNGFYDITSTPNSVFSIKCDPQGTKVNRLHLMIRPGILTGITWKFPRNLSGTETRCIERRAPEQVEDLNTTYELWEITFPQPVHDPFVFQLELLMLPSNSTQMNSGTRIPEQTADSQTTIRVDHELISDFSRLDSGEQENWWRKHFPNGLNLPLIDVPDAIKCSGTITLQNDVTDEVLVETQEMIPSILSQKETSKILFKTASEDCGLYRYTPHSISNTPGPQLKLQWRSQNIGVQKAWVWGKFCQSQFFTNGTILHSASFKIENIDTQELELLIRSRSQTPLEFLGIIVNDVQVPFETLMKSKSSEVSASVVSSTENTRNNESVQTVPSVPSISSQPESQRNSVVPTKGIRAVISSARGKDFRLVIPFPVWQRENEVIVQWLEHQPAWSAFTKLNPPEISTNLLVLQSSWQAWIPEDFVPFGEGKVLWKNVSPKTTSPKDGTPETVMDSEKISESRNFLRDSLFLRLFGPFRLGKNIFSKPEDLTLTEIESPIQLDSRSLEKLSSFGSEEDSDRHLSHLAILSTERIPHSIVGWNAYTQSNERPVLVIYGNILEASRWFLLLFVGFISSWILTPYRLLRVWICGVAGVLCMLVPLVWTPFFSGIFLGVGVSFINSSVHRHIRYSAENSKPVISVKQEARKVQSIETPELVESVKNSQVTKNGELLEDSSIVLHVEPRPVAGSNAGSTMKKEEKS